MDRSLHVVPASPNQGRPSVEAVLPGADLTTLESVRFTDAELVDCMKDRSRARGGEWEPIKISSEIQIVGLCPKIT